MDKMDAAMPAATLSEDDYIAQLQRLLDGGVALGIPGISAAIGSSSSPLLHLIAGDDDLVDRESARNAKGINPETAFGIGSITKVFVAVVVLQLVQEGKLHLDDQGSSILGADVLEGIANAPHATISQLLSHHSGIASWEDEVQWQRDGRGQSIQPSKIWKKDETLQYVRKPEVHGFTPGAFHYANTNYTILGLIIEHVTHNTAEDEVRRRILSPLEMAATYFEGFQKPSEDKTPRRYHFDTETFRRTAGVSPHFVEVRRPSCDLLDVTGTNLSVSWTAGGMVSTPTDLLKFAAGIRNGTLLNAEGMKIFMDWHAIGEKKGSAIGHGVFRFGRPGLPGTWVGHDGGVLGFTSVLAWEIDGPCIVAVLCNVGASHAGSVPCHAGTVGASTEFLTCAGKLVRSTLSE